MKNICKALIIFPVIYAVVSCAAIDKEKLTDFLGLNQQSNISKSEEGIIDNKPLGTRDIQEYLHSLGYKTGAIDGIMGKNTSNAIKKFQKDHELPVTGKVDDATVSAIKKLTSNSKITSETGDKKNAGNDIQIDLNPKLPEQQALLAYSYSEGVNGLEQDFRKSFYWYEKSANSGYAPAQYKLAMLYAKGQGAKIDENKFYYWIEQSAKNGDSKGQFVMSMLLQNNDEQKAHYWLVKSFEQGNPVAQYEVGISYCKGEKVPLDENKCEELLIKSARQGFKFAVEALAQLKLKKFAIRKLDEAAR